MLIPLVLLTNNISPKFWNLVPKLPTPLKILHESRHMVQELACL